MSERPVPDAPGDDAPAQTRWVLPVTILGSSLSFIDGSVVNVALPAMQSSLDATISTMQWVVNGYMLMLSSLILIGGSLGDRYGRRNIFILGVIVFAIASAGCGIASTAAELIAGRLLQGIGAALLVPASLAIIGTAYSEKTRGKAIGTWAAAAAIMAAIGPPLGGWLVDTTGWRSIFFINPPIAAVTLLLALKLPVDGKRAAAPLDWAGSALAVIFLSLLSYGLVALGDGMRLVGTIAVALSVPAAVLFLVVEAKSPAPMMPLGLFRDRNFAGANAITVVLYAGLSASLFILPFMLIRVHGYSASATGMALLPFAVIIGLGSRWAGELSDRFGTRLPLIAGPAIAALGFALLALIGDNADYWAGPFAGLVLAGTGMAICIPPLTSTVFASVPHEQSGTASGINNVAARGGGLLAVAAIGLAFGGADLANIEPAVVTTGFRLVMVSAAVLAAISALFAAVSIQPVKTREKPGLDLTAPH
ncbi:MFS transporter [Rhizobium sp. KVB221]|uniref:MFS transporter n=2 Tax=Rhizobium setariae TaxID=2801340 RepID=A0A936YNU4_9HYPH|nr:MFS transporter [Rhizobium setariae]